MKVTHAALNKFIVKQSTIESDKFYDLEVYRMLRKPKGKVPRLDCRREMGENAGTEK